MATPLLIIDNSSCNSLKLLIYFIALVLYGNKMGGNNKI